MKVQIEGNLYLESDTFQFTLKEYTGNVSKDKKTGKESETYTVHAYLTSIEHAFKYILRQKIKASTATNVRELIIELRQIKEWLHSIFGEEIPTLEPLPFADEDVDME